MATEKQVNDKLQKLEDALIKVSPLLQSLENAKSLPQNVQTNLTGLKTELQQLQAKVNTANTQTAQITTFFNQTSNIQSQVNTQLEEARNKLSEFDADQSKRNEAFEKLSKNVDEIQKRSENLAHEVSETLNLATNTAISKDFGERSEKLSKTRKWWGGVVAGYAIIFAGVFYFVLNQLKIGDELQNLSQLGMWTIKAIILIPFIYLLYFVIGQYNHERELEEKYAFKSLTAQTLQNNVKLLHDEFSKEEYEKLRLKFMIDTINQVYKEPTRKTFMSFWVDSRFAKAGFKEEHGKENDHAES